MLNKAILMGRLTADPELRYTQNNTPVTSFTLAVNRTLDRQQADFIEVVAWQKTAQFVCQYFQKGQPMIVEGRIQTRTWEDKQGGQTQGGGGGGRASPLCRAKEGREPARAGIRPHRDGRAL